LEEVYNISKKTNSKAMPLKAFWLGKSHLLCRWSFTAKRKPSPLEEVYNISKKINLKAMPLKAFWPGNHRLLCRWWFTMLCIGKLMIVKVN